jgi:rRNA-processing protein FCF1
VAVELVDPVKRLSQGDVLAAVPSVYVRSLAYLVKEAENKFRLAHKLPDAVKPEAVAQANVREVAETEGEDAFGNAVGARRLGMVISHDCELDKTGAKRYVLMAQIRPLSGVSSDKARESIRDYDQKRTLYIPENGYLEGEQFVDLRMLTTLRRDEVVDQLKRVASLNEDGRHLLRFQLFRYLARKRLPDDWVTWPDESEEDELF